MKETGNSYFKVDPYSRYTKECRLDDLGHLGLHHFILRRIDVHEAADVDTDPVLRSFKIFSLQIPCESIMGYWRSPEAVSNVLDILSNCRSTFAHIFTSTEIFTSGLHRRRRDYSISLVETPQEKVGQWENSIFKFPRREP